MLEKESQVKNSFIYLLPVVVGNLIPLITLPIFTRILTKEDYGIWGLAQVYAVFMTGIANFGLIVGYERNFFQYRASKKSSELLYSVLFFVFIAFIVTGILTYLLKSYIAKWIIGSSEHSNILFWSYCSTAIVSLKNYYLIYFRNTENAKSYAKYMIDENLLGVALSLFMVAYLRIGIIGLIFGQLLASLIIFCVLCVNFMKLYPLAFDSNILKDSLKLSLPLTPKIFFGVIGSQFDKYMIGLLSSLGGVGVYSIGQKISYVIFTLMTAIQNVYAPQVYRRMFDMGDEGGEAVGRYLTPFLYISIFIALLMALFSEELIVILTPVSYHGAVDIVIVLSMLYGSYFFGKQPQLIYAKKTHITSILTIVGIALNIIINVPFIHKWGAIGAAWGTLLAGLISGGILFIVSQHYYEIKWNYKEIGAIFIIFSGSAAAMIFMRNIGVSYELRFVVKIISLISYLYLGMKLNVLTRQNYLLIKNILLPVKVAS